MRHAFTILRKDMLERMRDRTGLLVAFVVPVAMAFLMGSALGGANRGLELDLGLVAAKEPAQVDRQNFEAWLGEKPWLGPGLRLHHYADPESGRRAVEAGQLGAAIVFDDGVSRVLAMQRGVFAARSAQSLIDRYRAESGSGSVSLAAVHPVSAGGKLRMIDYFAASMTVLFLNFGVLSGVRALKQEQDSGALARLAAAPVRPAEVLIGKFAGLFAVGLVQIVVMIVATHWLFGTRWGNPVPVAALALATVSMAVGLSSFFMSLGRTPEQGYLYASLGIFVLAIVGGQFMPPQGLPDVYDTLQRLTPNGQAARAFVDIAAAGKGGGLGGVLEPLVYTSLVGAAGIAFGLRHARASLTRSAA